MHLHQNPKMMGFKEEGVPLPWKDSLDVIDSVKRDGIAQLIHVWRLNRHREDIDLKWGDEVEYQLVHLDHTQKEAKLCVDGPAILADLIEREKKQDWPQIDKLGQLAQCVSGASSAHLRGSEWHPEFGAHMIEATPNPPYDMSVNSLLDVEDSLISRRYKLQSILPPHVYAVSLSAYPHLGVGQFTWSEQTQDLSPSGDSLFIPKSMVCPHPRFGTLVANVNSRRGVRVAQLVPLFQDHHTQESPMWTQALPMTGDRLPDRRQIIAQAAQTHNPVASQIFMDHFGFGMGQCCLQVTFGCPNIDIARNLYDQMSVLAPIFLALSAGTPILRGLLADTDTRWRVLEQGCDCRSDEELKYLERSRYGAVPMYIGTSPYLKRHLTELNDVDLPINKEAYDQLRVAKMDEILAKHFAHFWMRDPLVIFGDKIKLDNTTHVDHFENIQSTNWNCVRFKPPPVSHDGKTRSKIGWRVELRTPDLQISDFENAVLCSMSELLCLAILREGWQFYIPISQSIQNLATAHRRDAAIKELFWFRTNLQSDNGDATPSSYTSDTPSDTPSDTVMSDTARMTLKDIFLGSTRSGFPGLIPMLDKFVSSEWRNQRCSRSAVEKYRIYANYVRQKVLGQVWSDAKVIRHIVRSSPLYENDSIISSQLNYDINKFAVMAGFGLCREISPWLQPGCFPTTLRRLPQNLFKSSSTFIRAIASFPVEGSQTLGDKLVTMASDDSMSTRSDTSEVDTALTCRESIPSAQAVVEPMRPQHLLYASPGLTPAGLLTLPDFDPDLFLEMDKHSR
eukprot:Blabericola_migrator_1__2056@NODE_1564_length_4265_cov_755_051453_g1023_i0_p1_GENE_NODE_1564_length_4265_cov_755_051453_g1023_i0NODE_1564_length_4265_cov_755_051453_g1023_i0_p1_ORF_typecomplete_len791_score171_19GCS/PF03074_16/7_5e123GCS2/PF04107_13/11GCS2/PF04107_13/0_015UPF0172/PF03665_13/0_27_NODE_1564_length_4265_cov_755_051453_g1023_i018594231